MKRKSRLLLPVALTFGVLSPVTLAEPISDFRQAVTQTVMTNPRVNASWYNLDATREAQNAARGGYFPSVDLYADIGEEERETPLIETGSYSRDAVRFSVTQMLFDGFKTRDEVARLGFATLSEYYNLKRSSEEMALEAAVAYLDTMRYQKLVKLAEDNYVVHRQVFDKVAERTGGGVSQGVDLEQAAGRVALAESNLLTEMTNLHDVRARFQRVVGDLPAAELSTPTIPTSLIPQLRSAALDQAYMQSPEINAAIENLRSAQSALNGANASYMPRIDLRYRNEREHDTDGFDGRFEEEAIELVLNYNLFRGGADKARKRESYARYYGAVEERKQACLNVRQNVVIAFNDIKALEEQLIYLDRNRLSQDKTRRAYQDQFELKNRTLLDLLDSQNEYFDTQRTYYTAEANLLRAQATTLSGMGLLLAAVEVEGSNSQKISEMNLDLGRGDDKNGQALCPAETPEEVAVDKEALFAGLMTGNNRYRDRYTDDGKKQLALELEVIFAFNSSIIVDFDDEIANAAALLRERPDVKAFIEGHTDSTGTPEYNMWLSERRASAVRNIMIEKHNVNPDQVTAIGYGLERPIADNGTVIGRQQNRRVDLVLDANGG